MLGLSTKGLLGSFGLLGVGAAALGSDMIASKAQQVVGTPIPYANYMAAYGVGGVAGLAAKVAKDMFMPSMGVSGGSSQGYTIYG